MATETQANSSRTISTAELVQRLSRFDGPPDQFLRHLLTVQCRLVAAAAAAVVGSTDDGQQRLLAVWPEQQVSTPPEWLVQIGEALTANSSDPATRLVPLRRPDELYGMPASRHALVLPLRSDGGLRGVAAFVIDSRDRQVLETCRERLELTMTLLALYEMQLTLRQRQLQMQQLSAGMETTATLADQDRFTGAAMALVNDLAARWRCQRVGLGILQGRYVRLRALSHTEKFSRKMQLIGDIESSMEECLDQDLEILAPAPEEARYVYRAATALAQSHGPSHVLCLPLRHGGECKGVLLLQRPGEEPFQPAEVQALRLTADLAWPHLFQLSRHDRWFGAKLVSGTRRLAALAVGPKHTWAKVITLAITGFVLFALLFKGQYKVEAPFIITPETKRAVTAPFKSRLIESGVRLGDHVKAGAELARLDDSDLRDQLAEAKAKMDELQAEAAKAQGKGEWADARIYEAQATQYQARYDLLTRQMENAVIRAKVDGTIVEGDWRQNLNTMVDEGQGLFEIATQEGTEAELMVDERDVAEVKAGDRGTLATLGRPADRIGFTVIRVEPVATAEAGKNGFKIRVSLDGRPENLLLGQTGMAHVELDQRRYVWLWTHRAVDWLRLKLWW